MIENLGRQDRYWEFHDGIRMAACAMLKERAIIGRVTRCCMSLIKTLISSRLGKSRDLENNTRSILIYRYILESDGRNSALFT